jgi:cytidine deaminase
MTRPASAGAPSLESLRATALTAMERAYAPYSDFRVGAVLLGKDGSVFAGCNVENSAYPAGICAERSALAAAVAGGVRQFEILVVATEADEATPPCGMCRQALVEFAPTLTIVSYTKHGGEARWDLATLLPHPFTPAALAHHQ